MFDLERLFRDHRERVYRWALGLCGRHADAADICQEVFLRSLLRRPSFENESAATGWLRRVTSNIAIDRWRSRRSARLADSRREPISPAIAPDEELVQNEEAQRVRGALAALSEQQRLVLLAKAFDGRTFAEIAAEMGLAVPTVKTHYLRALEAVARVLSSKHEDAGRARPVVR
ncbi:MAG: RNA polymerase sigma factor [Phycisphaerales bacterium]|nr:RNA polymerase sigma factor [Phycisphaerales bacterium]